jgi:universal stress protein A
MDGYQRILIAADFSDLTTTVLQHTRLLADRFQATVHVLHVVEDPVRGVALEEAYVLPPDFVEQAEQRSRALLEQVFSPDDRQKYRAELSIREGSPFVEIVRYARDQQIDLILMGTHGRSAVSQMFVGSVVRQVMRHAPCPVLVVPTPNQQVPLP